VLCEPVFATDGVEDFDSWKRLGFHQNFEHLEDSLVGVFLRRGDVISSSGSTHPVSKSGVREGNCIFTSSLKTTVQLHLLQ
jgi:hypothetical protein